MDGVESPFRQTLIAKGVFIGRLGVGAWENVGIYPMAAPSRPAKGGSRGLLGQFQRKSIGRGE